MSTRAVARLASDRRGAVFVEHAIVLLPILVLALSSWEMLELWAGDSIVRRAASAAARAAVVVLPDDPAFYAGAPVDRFEGARKIQIELAASLVLASSPHFRSKPRVELSDASAHQPLTATVSAPFHCFGGWLSLVCAGPSRMLVARATQPYHGASYRYRATHSAGVR
jgi:Flp pilus assembly protein TadG